MMPTAPVHDHRPLWVGGHVRATCGQHFWLQLTNAPTTPKVGRR